MKASMLKSKVQVTGTFAEMRAAKAAGAVLSKKDNNYYFSCFSELYYSGLEYSGLEDESEALTKENINIRYHKASKQNGSPLLMQHQYSAVVISSIKDKFCFFFDTGTGKTLTALSIINSKSWQGVKWLVITPISVIKSGWLEDSAKFYPALKVFSLAKVHDKIENYIAIAKKWGVKWQVQGKSGRIKAKKEDIKNALIKECDVCVVNPQLLSSYSFKKEPGFEYSKAQLRRAKANTSKLLSLQKTGNFDGLIFDESVMLKNPKSLIFNAIKKIDFEFLYLLSGLPFDKPLEAWSQAYLIDPGVLGSSEWAFLHRYGKQDFFKSWTANDNAAEVIGKRLENIAYIVKKSDVLDLPPVTAKTLDIYTDKSNIKTIAEIEAKIIKDITLTNGLTMLIKLRQVASGFYKNDDGETINFKIKEKVNELERQLQGPLKNIKKVLIWVNFRQEELDIIELCEKLKTGYSYITGRTKDKDTARDNFMQDDSIKILICNAKAAGKGTDGLQKVCSTEIIYSLDFSHESYYQLTSRLDRKGQASPILRLFLTTADSIEEHIYKTVLKKGEIVEIIEKFIQG